MVMHLCHPYRHPENGVFAGCEGYFSHKNNQQINKLQKSSKKSDFQKEARTDTLTKDFINEYKNIKAHFKLRCITVISSPNANLFDQRLMRLGRRTVKHTQVGGRAKAKCSKKIPVHFFGSLRIPVHFFGSLRIPIHFSGSLGIPVHFSNHVTQKLETDLEFRNHRRGVGEPVAKTSQENIIGDTSLDYCLLYHFCHWHRLYVAFKSYRGKAGERHARI